MKMNVFAIVFLAVCVSLFTFTVHAEGQNGISIVLENKNNTLNLGTHNVTVTISTANSCTTGIFYNQTFANQIINGRSNVTINNYNCTYGTAYYLCVFIDNTVRGGTVNTLLSGCTINPSSLNASYANSTQLTDVNTTVSANTVKIGDVNTTVSANTVKIGDVNTTVGANTVKITDVNATVTQLVSWNGTTWIWLNSINTSVLNLLNSNSTIFQKLADVNSTVGANTVKITDVNATVGANTVKISDVNTTLRQRITDVNGSIVSSNETQLIIDVNATVTQLVSSNATIWIWLNSMNSSVLGLLDSNTTTNQRITDANSTTNTRISDVNITVDANTVKISDVNSTKAGTGNCADGFAVQNTTTSGVQCVNISVEAAGETDPVALPLIDAIYTVINNSKLNITDQRYNDTIIVSNVNATVTELISWNTTTWVWLNSLNTSVLKLLNSNTTIFGRVSDINTTVTNLLDSNTTTNTRINNLNGTKGGIGNCTADQVVMNVTESGVQCTAITVSETDPIATVQISDVNSTVNQLLNSNTSTNTRISDVNVTVGANSVKISDVNVTAGANSVKISDVNTTVGANTVKITDVNVTVTQLVSWNTTNWIWLNSMNTSVLGLLNSNTSTNTRINDVNSTAVANSVKISDVNATVLYADSSRNLTNNLSITGSGSIRNNATCVSIYSPSGNSVFEACD